MKKNLLTLLFLSSLIVTGCSSEGGKGNKSSKQNYSDLFTLVSPEEPVCMVRDQVKEYSDLRNAAKAENMDKENNIYDLGTEINVKNYKGDYDQNIPVELSFSVDESLKSDEYIVRYWVEGDEDNYHEIKTTKNKVSLPNLYRSTTYEWEVEAAGKVSNTESFVTGDYVRILSTSGNDDIQNIRDCGGWTTLDGKRYKQGLVYRGYEFNDHKLSNGHAQNINGDTDPAKKFIIDDLGIRMEIDLRSDTEADISDGRAPINYTTAQPGDDNFVDYARHSITSYLRQTADEAQYKIIFEDYFTKADEKPCYFHCYGGADRTGTIAFLLGGLLGMSYTDLIIDFEATTFYGSLKEHNNKSDQYTLFVDMLKTIKGWDFYSSCNSLKEVCETFLTQTCGVSTQAIEKIREIMLEDID